MTIRNRELSQFGSFIYIEDSTKSVGIATEETPYVGIGTTNAQYKLHIVGDAGINGNLTINGNLYYNGSLDFDEVNLNTTGIITARGFFNQLGEELIGFDSWEKDNSNIYRLNGNVGLGTSNPIEKLEVKGNISAIKFISTTTTGSSPFEVLSQTLVTNLNADYLRGGIPGANINSFDIVTRGDSQTISNKTLVSPIISNTLKFGAVTLSSPTTGDYNISLPAESGTLLTSGSGGIITGLVTTGNIQNGTILNEDIANLTIQNTKLANSTISGISLGSNLNNLTAGSFVIYSTGSTYNGSAAITISVNASTTNQANTVVARNASGDFSAGTITIVNLTASQTVQAQDFNSTSDQNLKENIKTLENALEIINDLRGVSFDWKDTKKPSIGVIAQELETVFPELVSENSGHKTVNYNGIIPVLIEAIKELSEEVKKLKSTK